MGKGKNQGLMSSDELESIKDKKFLYFIKKHKKTLIIASIAILVLIVIIIIVAASSGNDSKDPKNEPLEKTRKKLKGVTYHTIEEVKQRIASNTPSSSTVTYKTEPKTTAPYAIGRVSDASLNNAMKIFNNFRYIAGIPPTVGLSENYIELAQAASLLMAVNNKMAHSGQPQPSGMSDEMYKKGSDGCGSSNIAWGYRTLNSVVFGWVEDTGNFSTMGHRRWILNPSMTATGLGIVGTYSAMYAFDNSFGATDYYGVSWPGQNTPLDYFQTNCAWTYSHGKSISHDDIVVTLKNLKDGSTLKFSKSNPNTFLIQNSNYGKPGCIIFQPSLSYKDGDTYEVGIHGTDVNVDYTVHFFAS